MSNEIISVEISPPHSIPGDHVIMLNEALVKSSKISTHKVTTLQFGSAKSQVKLHAVPRLEGMRISYHLAKKLNISQNFKLRMKVRQHAQVIKLGPVLGVMVNQIKSQAPSKPFGNNTAFCKELADACLSEGIIVYYFSPTMLKTQGQGLEGWYYYGGWRKANFPFPNVIYNRLTSRILENKAHVQRFMKEMKSRYKTKIFNEKYLDKTEVFQALKTIPALRRYLPESYQLSSFSTLKSMCHRYPTVFLKPILGSLGKGIIRISRQPNGTFVCQTTNMRGSNRQSYNNISSLYASLTAKLKVRRYQIQQGLNLIRVNNRPVDFRALVQKNQDNQWVVTSIVARIAGNHHFVSNLARGGTLSPVMEALNKARLSSPKQVNIRLRKAAADIAKGIQTTIPENFGELGVDLAVDEQGKVWLLEVNSKPSKNDNTSLNDTKIRPSVRQATKYVRHLSGF